MLSSNDGAFIKQENKSLKQSLNVFSLSLFGIGTIIGAGIYSVTGIAYGYAGESLWISFILAGLAAICTAFSYCELAAMYPSSGAEYTYINRAFPNNPYLGFLLAMILFFAGASITSTVAISFAGYFQFFLNVPVYLVAIGLMLVCTLINNRGLDKSNKINIIFTFIELLGILIVIWFGFRINDPVSGPSIEINKGTMLATSLIFFVYLGFEEIVNLSEEAKNPDKDIPKSIFISLAVTTLLYLAVSFAVIRLVRPENLEISSSPLADAITKVAPSMSKVMAIIALISTANTVLVTLLVQSRLVFCMAREGDLPQILGRIHNSFSIPHIASFFVLIISCLLLFFNNFELLVSFSSFATLLAFILVNLSLIVLRYKKPLQIRPYKVPVNAGSFPIIPSAGIIISIIMCLQFNSIIYGTTIVVIILSTIYYWLKKNLSN